MGRPTPTCPYCRRKAVKQTGKQVHPHLPRLKNKLFWVCIDCDARVGCHDDGRPLGTLANGPLRNARKRAHDQFDLMWQSGRMKRKDAYAWLAAVMDMTAKQAHIGKFNLEQCNKLIAIMNRVKAINPDIVSG